jgi:hypothetical protein
LPCCAMMVPAICAAETDKEQMHKSGSKKTWEARIT